MKTYQILIDAAPYAPENFGQVKIQIDPYRDNGAYVYRKKLTDNLVFTKAAYSYILQQINISQCQEIEIEIQERCTIGAGWETIIYGIFTRQACVVNYDRCNIEVEVQTVDEYTCVIDNGDKDINLAEIEYTDIPVEDLPFNNLFNIEVLVVPDDGDNDCIDDLPEWGLPYNAVSYPGVSTNTYCLWVREVATVPCVGGVPNPPPSAASDWNLLVGCGANNTSKWWRRIDAAEVALTVTTTACTPDPCTPVPCAAGCIDGGIFAIPLGWERVCVCLTVPLSIRDCRSVTAVIDYILADICDTGTTLDSELLTNATNPVTGVNPNPLGGGRLLIAAKSNLTNADASNLANNYPISILKLLGDLSKLLNAMWYINPTLNKLIFEHVTAILSNTVGIDLTTLDSGKWDKGRRLVSWDKDQVPRAEVFGYAQPCESLDFIGRPITYNTNCTYTRQIETRTEVLEAEVSRIFQNPNDGNNGLVLIANGSLELDGFTTEDGEISNEFIPNAPLSWANLHRDYFRDYRFLYNGTLNGTAAVFTSTRPIKRQEGLIFPIQCLNSFDPYKLIKTSIGEGRLETAIYDVASGTIECTIKFEDAA
jgi:hypothetical protein